MTARDVLHWLESKVVYSVGFGVVLMLGIGAALFYFNEGPSKVQVVRIAYGAGAPVRKRFLEQMALHARERNLEIRLIADESTDQTLTMLDQHDADLGLIAGVVADRGSRRVLEVTPLYMEPLQLLVKEGLYESVLKDFGQLRGKSIDLDNETSATNLLASELLRFMGLADQDTGQRQYQPVHLPLLKVGESHDGASLPDAIFQIGGVPSASIRSLVAHYNYRLVPLPFGAPFSLDKFRDAEMPDPAAHSNLRLDKSFIEEAVIPAYAYSVLPPVPPIDTRTIATRLTMVGSDRLDSHVVHQVLALIFSPEVSGFANPPLNVDLLDSSFQFERHPGTDKYLSSLKPVDVEGAFTAYARMGEIWGLVITLYIAAAKGLKAWRDRRVAEHGAVADFLKQVLEVEAEAGPSCSDAERISLDQRLSDIKKGAIQLHLDGRLQDAEELPSLLVMLADTRTRIWGRAS